MVRSSRTAYEASYSELNTACIHRQSREDPVGLVECLRREKSVRVVCSFSALSPPSGTARWIKNERVREAEIILNRLDSDNPCENQPSKLVPVLL